MSDAFYGYEEPNGTSVVKKAEHWTGLTIFDLILNLFGIWDFDCFMILINKYNVFSKTLKIFHKNVQDVQVFDCIELRTQLGNNCEHYGTIY